MWVPYMTDSHTDMWQYDTNYYRHGELNLVKRMENILAMPVKPDFVEVMTWVNISILVQNQEYLRTLH